MNRLKINHGVAVGAIVVVTLVTCLAIWLSSVDTHGDNEVITQEAVISYQVNNDHPVFPNRSIKVTLIAVGDIMLGRTVMTAVKAYGDVDYPFVNTADILKSGDITFGNLESPIVNACPKIDSGYTFCTDPALVPGVVGAGFDVLTLANNHMFNFGKAGFENTKQVLSEFGIDYVGYLNGVVKDIQGIRVGFVGLDFVTSAPTQNDLEHVSDYAALSDVLVVGVHWGVEYTTEPTAQQRNWAQKLVDSGADIIIGSHPHWVQGRDMIDGKPVYWSLGNFVFDQMWSEETKKGVIAKITFDQNGFVSDELINTYIRTVGQPEIVEQ